MLVLSLVCDVSFLGVLEGRGHVAGRGELLLDAGDLDLALGSVDEDELPSLAGDQRSFAQRCVIVVLLHTTQDKRHCGMKLLWTNKNTRRLKYISFLGTFAFFTLFALLLCRFCIDDWVRSDRQKKHR